jgi:outer membrane immunogenic protein
MIKQLLLAATAVVLVGSQAMAADLPVRQPITKAPPLVQPAFDWSGFYIGGQVGGAWGTASYTTPSTAFSTDYDVSGVIGGGHAGFMWQTGPAVFGVEADFNGTGVEGDDAGAGGALDKTKLNWAGSVRGVLGFTAWDPRWLVYGTGGWAFGDVDHCFDGINAACVSKTHSGWTAGGGLKYAFTPNWIAGVEYRYTRYQDEVHAVPVPAFSRTVDLNTNEVTFRLSYKFGGPLIAKY